MKSFAKCQSPGRIFTETPCDTSGKALQQSYKKSDLSVCLISWLHLQVFHTQTCTLHCTQTGCQGRNLRPQQVRFIHHNQKTDVPTATPSTSKITLAECTWNPMHSTSSTPCSNPPRHASVRRDFCDPDSPRSFKSRSTRDKSTACKCSICRHRFARKSWSPFFRASNSAPSTTCTAVNASFNFVTMALNSLSVVGTVKHR